MRATWGTLVDFSPPVTINLALRGSVDPWLSTEAARSCESPAGGEVDSGVFCLVLLAIIVYIFLQSLACFV